MCVRQCFRNTNFGRNGHFNDDGFDAKFDWLNALRCYRRFDFSLVADAIVGRCWRRWRCCCCGRRRPILIALLPNYIIDNKSNCCVALVISRRILNNNVEYVTRQVDAIVIDDKMIYRWWWAPFDWYVSVSVYISECIWMNEWMGSEIWCLRGFSSLLFDRLSQPPIHNIQYI